MSELSPLCAMSLIYFYFNGLIKFSKFFSIYYDENYYWKSDIDSIFSSIGYKFDIISLLFSTLLKILFSLFFYYLFKLVEIFFNYILSDDVI